MLFIAEKLKLEGVFAQSGRGIPKAYATPLTPSAAGLCRQMGQIILSIKSVKFDPLYTVKAPAGPGSEAVYELIVG
jgi:hypothetical protein